MHCPSGDVRYIGTVAGIGVGILIPIIVVIVLIVLFVVMTRDKQQGDYETYERGE